MFKIKLNTNKLHLLLDFVHLAFIQKFANKIKIWNEDIINETITIFDKLLYYPLRYSGNYIY